MDDKQKSLNLMRFGIFGALIIIWVSALIFVGAAMGTGMAIFSELNFWIAFIVSIVLSAGWYYAYKWYLYRDK